MYTALFVAFASLLSPSQEAMTSVQYVPSLNLCGELIESEDWKIYATTSSFKITPMKIAGSGRWRKPSFYIQYSSTGKIRYRLSLGMGHVPGRNLNHYVYADGKLVHAAGYNEISKGNDRAIGLLTDSEFAKMKSADRVEIRITRSSVLEGDKLFGSVTMNLRGLSRIETIGRRLMEVVRKKKATTNCK